MLRRCAPRNDAIPTAKRRAEARRYCSRLAAEDFFGAQLGDVGAREAEPADEYLLGVLAELGRGLQFGRPSVEAHRPGLALEVAVRVFHHLHDAALVEALVVLQFEGVMDGPGWHTGRADDLHRLFLGVVLGPLGDDLVDEPFVLVALFVGREARVGDQFLAADDLEEAGPVLRVGAAAEHIDVVVVAARLARVDAARRRRARGRLRAHARRRLLVALLVHHRERGADVVHHRILHRQLQAAALAGLALLVERAQDADRHQHAGAGVADRAAGLDRRLAGFARHAHRAA